MANLYHQPHAFRFGTVLQSLIDDSQWTKLEIGVAWVRRSGMQYLQPALTRFLQRGGVLRVAVGIDIENTSKEGLEALFRLINHGDAEIYVYHNEASSTFHPKLYLFSNYSDAKLIVGSNNLTESGLFLNVEASLEIDAPISTDVIVNARATLAGWRDVSSKLSLQLTEDLISDLVELNYIYPEQSLQQRQRRRPQATGDTNTSSKGRLFGRQIITPPIFKLAAEQDVANESEQISDSDSVIAESQGAYETDITAIDDSVTPSSSTKNTGRVLIMRVRKASATARPTQIQIPFELYADPFFDNVSELISAHDSAYHPISVAEARGGRNTLKLEVPEIRTFEDPVLRIEHTPQGVVYQAYDANSYLGGPLMASLMRGLEMKPPHTRATRPNKLQSSTLWRFI